ncbi:hypothetical protein ACFQZQ_08925 [Lysobacter koreensis]|uniref:Thioredoxin n=1 Tax=Lysobacter koreensis TaxID=266122 RepID=A0ABW2YMI2_9GAMM
MADTVHPAFFDRFPMQRVSDAGLDAVLATHGDALRILFLWGRDCPNCDIAKGQMLLTPQRFQWPDVQWLHDNVYDDPTMGTRFGLHGIPAFIVFRGARRLGRIGQWPGPQAFVAAIEKLRTAPAEPA